MRSCARAARPPRHAAPSTNAMMVVFMSALLRNADIVAYCASVDLQWAPDYCVADSFVNPTLSAAERPLRVALIGFGYWGPNYARVLHDLPTVELTAVCDSSAGRLAQVRQRYPSVATFPDLAGA